MGCLLKNLDQLEVDKANIESKTQATLENIKQNQIFVLNSGILLRPHIKKTNGELFALSTSVTGIWLAKIGT